MSSPDNAQKLDISAYRLIQAIADLTKAALAGTDSVEYAAKIKVLAPRAALASTDFFEALSVVHCDNLNIPDETPCENSDDFAEWAGRVAHSRTYAPFEGIRGPTLHVDLRPVLAAE